MLKVHHESAGPLEARSGPQTKEGSPKRVSGLSHDSMCGCPRSPLCWHVSGAVLVWSLLARQCYCCLLRWSACLLISSFFWDCILFFSIFFFCNIKFLHTSPCPHLLPPRFSLALTHTPAHMTTPQNLTSPPQWIPLFAVSWVRLRSLTVVLVFLQSRKASDQAKSVDSKTDSIGSGRAIPIKQVSTFTLFFFTSRFS